MAQNFVSALVVDAHVRISTLRLPTRALSRSASKYRPRALNSRFTQISPSGNEQLVDRNAGAGLGKMPPATCFCLRHTANRLYVVFKEYKIGVRSLTWEYCSPTNPGTPQNCLRRFCGEPHSGFPPPLRHSTCSPSRRRKLRRSSIARLLLFPFRIYIRRGPLGEFSPPKMRD